MKKVFPPNIARRGRLMRALIGLLLLSAGVLLLQTLLTVSILLLALAAFVFFEAARGWCFLRACGIKTRV